MLLGEGRMVKRLGNVRCMLHICCTAASIVVASIRPVILVRKSVYLFGVLMTHLAPF